MIRQYFVPQSYLYNGKSYCSEMTSLPWDSRWKILSLSSSDLNCEGKVKSQKWKCGKCHQRNFLSLTVPNFLILTSSVAARDENLVSMMKFPLQSWYDPQFWLNWVIFSFWEMNKMNGMLYTTYANAYSWIKILYICKCLIDNKLALLQVMAWHRTGAKTFLETMMQFADSDM